MKTYYNIIISALLFLTLAVSCKKENPTNPAIQEEKDPFSVELNIDNTGNGEATVTFMPNDDSTTYYFSVITKNEHRNNDGDAYLVKRDKALIKGIAGNEKISVEEYLGSVLKSGEYTHTFKNLNGNEDYFVYAYEMDTKGNAGMKVYRQEFRTGEKFYESFQFDFEVLDLGMDCFDIKVTPETDNCGYLYFFIDDEVFKTIGGENGYGQYIDEYLRFYSERYGIQLSDVINMFTHKGTKTFTHSELLPKTEYHSFCAIINENGETVSNIASSKTTTDEVDYLDIKFDVTVSETGPDYAKVKVTPSEPTPYLTTFVTEEDYLSFNSDEKLMKAVIDSYGMYLPWQILNEEYEFNVEELTPETTYYILVFGADTKSLLYTTRLTAVEFTTQKESIPTDVTFDISFNETSAFTVKVDYTPSNENVYYFFDVIEQSVYNDVYGGKPEGLADYMSDIFETIMSEYPETTKEELIEMLRQRGKYSYQFNFLEPDKTYYAWAAVIDKSGNFVGTPTLKEFKSLPFEQSETKVEIVLDKYFDGSELAELDPYQYSSLQGLCIAPVSYNPDNNALHWYAKTFDGDLTGEDITEEDLIRSIVMDGDMDSKSLIFQLPWNNPLTYCAVAMDSNGKFGKVTRVLKSYDPAGASPAEDFQMPSNTISKAAALQNGIQYRQKLAADSQYGKFTERHCSKVSKTVLVTDLAL